MPENIAVWISFDNPTSDSSAAERVYKFVDEPHPGAGGKQRSVGLIVTDETWEALTRAYPGWPRNRRCVIGLDGLSGQPRLGRTWKLENFLGYELHEAHRMLLIELESPMTKTG